VREDQHTAIEVLISEEAVDVERVYWQRLHDLGLIKQVRSRPVKERPFTPVRVTGELVSQTIIEGRR
jgi:hypothetical protein